MWSSKIAEKNIVNGVIVVNIQFSDGADSFNRVYQISSGEQLNQMIDAELKRLNLLSTEFNNLVIGDFTPTPVLQQEDPIQKLKELKQLADLGVIEANDPDLAKALADAKASI